MGLHILRDGYINIIIHEWIILPIHGFLKITINGCHTVIIELISIHGIYPLVFT